MESSHLQMQVHASACCRKRVGGTLGKQALDHTLQMQVTASAPCRDMVGAIPSVDISYLISDNHWLNSHISLCYVAMHHAETKEFSQWALSPIIYWMVSVIISQRKTLNHWRKLQALFCRCRFTPPHAVEWAVTDMVSQLKPMTTAFPTIDMTLTFLMLCHHVNYRQRNPDEPQET